MAETPDSHDLDKLNRWHDGLISETGAGGRADGEFPVCALFLVSGEDRRAHDIFRVYRAAFEELGAGFHDLVIFGQHGVSGTSEGLVPGLGLAGLRIPSLVLITRRDPPGCYTTALPSGALGEGEAEDAGEEIPWMKALDAIRNAVVAGSPPGLEGIDGLARQESPTGTLANSVARVIQQVESA